MLYFAIMVVELTHRLSKRQLDCLTLAATPMTSKEIGRELNISSRTVEVHLDKAVQILGAANRMDAVRMLRAMEEPTTYQTRRYPEGLAEQAAYPVNSPRSDIGIGEGETMYAATVRQEQSPFQLNFLGSGAHFPLPIPRKGRRHNDLTILQRVGWTFAIIIGLAISTGVLLGGLTTISALIKALNH